MANDPIPIRPPQPGTDRFDDDVDLREYVAVVWRYRVLVLAIAALAVAVAVLDVLITPKAYEATVTLTVNQSKIGDEPPTPDASTSRVLLQNRRLADRVIQEFNLARPPY